MQKRYQVLIPDWLEDYLKEVSIAYSLNFSETIRAEVCIAIILSVQELFPDFQLDFSFTEMFSHPKQKSPFSIDREILKKGLSKLYFEARKAAEFRTKMLKSQREGQEG